MNCPDVKKWIVSSSAKDLHEPLEEVARHLANCKACNKNYHYFLSAYEFLNDQKQESLSEEKTELIVGTVLERAGKLNSLQRSNWFGLNKVAASVVLIIGLLSGIFVGRLINKIGEDQEYSWSEEFTLLSDNIEYSLFN